MFYSLLFLTALLSQLQGSSAASSQTRTMTAASGSIAALNNLVVIGDGLSGSGDGDISFSLYDWAVTTANVASANNYVQALAASNGGAVANTVTAAASGDLAGNTFKGLGHDVAIADANTVFVSQASVTAQTGRVVVYKGNATSFTQKQLLIPYDGKHRMDGEAMFGESISAKHDALAVGCQNCNSSAPVFSGAVYVYRPTKEGGWSETQTLTAEGVLFMGERVSIHDKVLVAAGDDSTGPGDARRLLASNQDFSNVANTVVVYEEGHHHKFEQRQVITTKSGSFRESITGLTVFDETIAITTMGTDLPGASSSGTADKVYVYYPMSKRYGLERKGKPSPQQWTNIQILSSSTSTDVRFFLGEPDTSISLNTLQYLTTDGTNVATAKTSRSCLSCKFDETVTVTADTPAIADTTVTMMTSDSTAFYSYHTGTANVIADPVGNTIFQSCLTLVLIDQWSDGWGVASLVVTSPSGSEERFHLQCTTENPQVYKYCPTTQEAGRYHVHIDKAEETPFSWEMNFKVAAGSSWYVGDKHTHMDFLWDEKYQDFHVGATKGVLPSISTCEVCDPNKPQGKKRSLSNLRALHHKGGDDDKTQSPTLSSAPTITTTGYTGYTWNQFVFVGTSAWFSNDYYGEQFYVSDREGRHLFQTGTRCAAGAAKETCWVELPDGDYTLRVGGSGSSSETYAFCDSSVDVATNTELQFTVLDQQCYAGLYTSVINKCRTNYKSDWWLKMDIILGGSASELTTQDESTFTIALSETMLSVLGAAPSKISFDKQDVTQSGVKTTVLVKFDTMPDAAAIENFGKDASSATSLLKYELIGAQALSSNFMNGKTSSVTIASVSTDGEARDFSHVDESSFKTVSDHAWLTASVETPSGNYNSYAKYVAEGAYALVAVAAVLAVSLFAKRAMAAKK